MLLAETRTIANTPQAKQVTWEESVARLARCSFSNLLFSNGNASITLSLHSVCKFVRCWLQRMCIIMLMEHSAPLQEGNRSCSVPIQRLDAVRPPSAEQIQRRLIHFLAELGLHQCGQTVYLLAHVRIAAGNVIVLYAAEIKHGRVPSQTPREFQYPCPTETRLPRRSPESRFPRRRAEAIQPQPPALPVLL